MKKVISLILAIVVLSCMLSSCAGKTDATSSTVKANSKDAVEIPAIVGTDLDSAKTILTSLGLVPIVLEEYSLNQAKGNIDTCNPDVGSSVKKKVLQ